MTKQSPISKKNIFIVTTIILNKTVQKMVIRTSNKKSTEFIEGYFHFRRPS
jgi:hypothetical protein